ncbi:ABC transporter permease [Microvirga sp. W0021]|uniref:ABC transporter permease n=1 Tax=Hohaiivirga grylli TaxID=3133970 RepID=A0ABV0BG54_9HYPH
MSLFAFIGGIEAGLIYAFVALAVYLSFRILDFPDLTVDGSFPLGAAVTATLISISGWNPWLATLMGMFAGSLGGLATAYFSVRWGILHLLASILTMTALYSINIRVMQGAATMGLLNDETILTPFIHLANSAGLPEMYTRPIVLAAFVIAAFVILSWFLNSELGLSMRATGANIRMSRAQGINTSRQVIIGMMISNALVGLGGSIYAQANGSADASLGTGTIVVGLAAVIISETLIPSRKIWVRLLACIVGAIVYRMVIQLAMDVDFLGFKASDLNLVTALIVLIALVVPKLKKKVFA